MSEFGAGVIRSTPRLPDQDAAAVRAVLWRVDRGQLDREGALNVLLALGLHSAAEEPKPPVRRVAPVQDPVAKQFRRPETAQEPADDRALTRGGHGSSDAPQRPSGGQTGRSRRNGGTT